MGASDPIKAELVILFDGICNLCNSSVQFVITHNSKGNFKFAALQSSIGQLYLHQLHSVILIKNGILFQKSSAALEIARDLDGLWPALYGLKIVPRILRDGVYMFVAKNRYTWFGKQDACMMPTPELKSRFIE
jgi:predicted DCC family thiol-disulfide oxidoreductase YuxK